MKAASMMAPEAPRCFPLKSASVIEASMVTGGASFQLPVSIYCSPLMVNFTNALMVVWTVQVLAKCISRWLADSLALGQEGGHNNRTRSTQLFTAEVGFGHAGLHSNGVRVAEGNGL